MKKIVNKKNKVLKTFLLLTVFGSILFFSFKLSEPTVIESVEDNADYCCCAYKYQLTNPYAKTYYSWMQVKTCKKTFAGNCSGKSKQRCN